MARVVAGGTMAVTAVVTALVTSLFWITAYSIALNSDRPASAPTAASPSVPEPVAHAPDSPDEVAVVPSGMAIPVAGVRVDQLVDTFTQSRSGGRAHDAIDIMAPAGTAVVAAAPGTVEKLFYSDGGGGITAYVRSPDAQWVYYYAHLQAYAPGLREGQRVSRGDPIGMVGSTGNADPAGPHLHFAIHRLAAGERWWQGSPINPYPLLAGRGADR